MKNRSLNFVFTTVKSENLTVFDFSNVTSLCRIKLAQECIVFAANF